MKKLLIAALIVVAAGTSAFAMDGTKKAVNSLTHASFKALFPGASNVSWDESADFFSAAFTMDDENYTAFFTREGDLIGTTQKVELSQLPAKAQRKIKKDYASFKVTEAIRFNQDDRSNYYVRVEDGNQKQILEVTAYGNVCVFKGKIN